MPAVQKFVENMTGLTPKESNIDPDLAVALGAAIQAGIYEGNVSDLMIMDVWQASLMRAYASKIESSRDEDQEFTGDDEDKNSRQTIETNNIQQDAVQVDNEDEPL